MHRYLRAVGFSEVNTRKQVQDLLREVIQSNVKKDYFETDNDEVLVECSALFCPSCGVKIRGAYDENSNLVLDYYFPFVTADKVSTVENVIMERHAATDSFAGLTEDYRVGVSLIFYLNNGLYQMKAEKDSSRDDKQKKNISFSALSSGGTIMLPIKKDPRQKEKLQKASADRNKRIIAAKNGDEEAIEQLTLEDIDTYSAVSKRILTDDVFTLVDSYLMPDGMECDHYSILAEIEDFRLEENTLSAESVYIMNLSCNGLPITICINKKDLLGEPEIGRRFRGNIWLQGEVNT